MYFENGKLFLVVVLEMYSLISTHHSLPNNPHPYPGLMFIFKYCNEGHVFRNLTKFELSFKAGNVSNFSLQEMLKKCHLCMESIVQAKDRQAAEANKNASILLEELDLEKVMEAVVHGDHPLSFTVCPLNLSLSMLFNFVLLYQYALFIIVIKHSPSLILSTTGAVDIVFCNLNKILLRDHVELKGSIHSI